MSAYTHHVRGRGWTALLTGLTALMAFALVAPGARASTDHSGFFTERDLAQAGWSTCGEAITWSADVRGLTTREARGEITRLKLVWKTWSAASGIPVDFVGRESLVFDARTNGLRPRSGSPRTDRHVYIAFKAPQQVPIMGANVVGLAMPTSVMMHTQEIRSGMAIFRRGYVKEQRRTAPDRVRHLYLHELGHVLGLGHARSEGNVMHPTLNSLTQLGEGDRTGIRARTQPCSMDSSR
jgi:hypothetical protein